MLSRDEALDGVFEGDFDDIPTTSSSDKATPFQQGSSNQKIQVSPRRRKEPREAGFSDDAGGGSLSSSFHSVSASGSFGSSSGGNLTLDDGTFPSISASPSPPSQGAQGSLCTISPSSSSGGSPGKIPRGAWVKPISSSSSGGGVGAGGGSPAGIVGSSSTGRSRGSSEEAEMDDDLKLAIQLSLKSAEDEAARRRV